MYVIGVCDDDTVHRRFLVEMCERYFAENDLDGRCVGFSNAEEVMRYSGEKMLLLFLDIEMGKISGIELAGLYGTRSKVWRIVFVTNHSERVYESFGFLVLGFECKPMDYGRLAGWIQIAEQENMLSGNITFRHCNKTISLNGGDIICFKAEGNYTLIFTEQKTFCVSGQLHVWGKKLINSPFIRCHRSYLINVLRIRTISAYDISLEGLEYSIPIGRFYIQNILRIKNSYLQRIVETRAGVV